jgi:hypothetical protein
LEEQEIKEDSFLENTIFLRNETAG